MKIASVSENKNIEKRIAITPEIAKKYIQNNFEVSLSKKYGEHLGFKDEEYKILGVKFLSDDKETLANADIVVQLGLLSEENLDLLKENQILVGVLDPYSNKNKIEKLVRRRGRVYIINKTNPKFKDRQK